MITLEYSWVETSNKFPKIYKANGYKFQDFLGRTKVHKLINKNQKNCGQC